MMHLIPYYIYKKAAMLKRKESSAPISRVLFLQQSAGACHLSNP